MLTIRTILHPTDFSEHSEAAFRLACALARDYNARLIVVHVNTSPTLFEELPVWPEEAEEVRTALRAQLSELQPTDPKIRIEYRLEEGHAVTEILRLAAQEKCNLIVMGTHGRTSFARLALGSVVESVQRKAPCPVLSVKLPLTLGTGEAPAPATENISETADASGSPRTLLEVR